jgi:hypothetical protein
MEYTELLMKFRIGKLIIHISKLNKFRRTSKFNRGFKKMELNKKDKSQ